MEDGDSADARAGTWSTASAAPCHDLQSLVDSARIPRDAWAAVPSDMRQQCLGRVPAQRDRILEYLAVYLGPNPPPAAAAAAPSGAQAADGAHLYAQNCLRLPPARRRGRRPPVPPLAGNPDLFLDRLFSVYVVLNGFKGEVTVEGTPYRGAMPPFAHLSDAGVAAVVNHVRSAWGNDALRPAGMADVDAAGVADARQKPMTPAAVLAYRVTVKRLSGHGESWRVSRP